MSQRDQLLKAVSDLQRGSSLKALDSATCRAAYETVKRLAPVVQPRGDEDVQVKNAGRFLRNTAAGCFARAGACDAAWDVWQKEPNAIVPGLHETDVAMKNGFMASTMHKCPR